MAKRENKEASTEPMRPTARYEFIARTDRGAGVMCLDRELYSKKQRVIQSCGISSQRVKLIFFGIELSGCLGQESEGPEGLKKI
jgi:hypothetical protein